MPYERTGRGAKKRLVRRTARTDSGRNFGFADIFPSRGIPRTYDATPVGNGQETSPRSLHGYDNVVPTNRMQNNKYAIF